MGLGYGPIILQSQLKHLVEVADKVRREAVLEVGRQLLVVVLVGLREDDLKG